MPYSAGYAIADIAALKAIALSDLINGYTRWVISKNTWYGWEANSTDTANDDTVVAINSDPSTGRFIALGSLYSRLSEQVTLTDNDLLLIAPSTSNSIKKVKLSTIKQYINGTPIVAVPPSGSVKWYRADSAQTSGSYVTGWTDSSTGNNLVVYSSAPSQATLLSNAVNGKPAVTFTDAAMYSASQSYAAKTIFLVYRSRQATTFSNYDGYFSYRTNSSAKVPVSNENLILTGVRTTSNLYLETTSTAAYFDNQNISNLADFNNYQVGINKGDANNFHLLEMQQSSSVAGTKNLLIGADNFSDPNYANPDRYAKDLDIAEFIVYPNILTSAERTAIYQYFKERYSFSFI